LIIPKTVSKSVEVEAYPLLSIDTSSTSPYDRPNDEDSDTETGFFLTTKAVRRSRKLGRKIIAESPEMAFFDNLRGWDKFKIYRYVILLALSLSGDGW